MKETKRLKPFIGLNLDILFMPLNPSEKSENDGHYFSQNKIFWNQLYSSGLITKKININNTPILSDVEIFKKNSYNYNNFNYGIKDLVPDIVSGNSKEVRSFLINNEEKAELYCSNFKNDILKYNPKVVIMMHRFVADFFYKKYLKNQKVKMNQGFLGRPLIEHNCKTNFFIVPFPSSMHQYDSSVAVNIFKQVKNSLETLS